MSINHILLDLEVIKQLVDNDKLGVLTLPGSTKLCVDSYGYSSSITRWYNNYNRETLWIGLKRYIKSINGIAVEYEKLPFLYDDFDNFSEHKYYTNNCFTFPKRLQKDEHYNMSENEIIDKINNKFWDLIIYGKVGPDEYCNFPYFNSVKANYDKNKIAFIFGGDEIFNLKTSDYHGYRINMFNRYIYYKPYADYLNYYKQFGTCFVRELKKN